MTCRLCPAPALRGDTLCGEHAERAAILEYDAGLSREQAERRTAQLHLKALVAAGKVA